MSNDKDVELENENNDVDLNYQPPPQKTIEEIVNADQEDESLRKYKEALLGNLYYYFWTLLIIEILKLI